MHSDKDISATNAYFLKNDEKAIRREIWKTGPVQGSYDTYQDFRLYKGGIYEVCSFLLEKAGPHASKCLPTVYRVTPANLPIIQYLFRRRSPFTLTKPL